ncbi:MAG: SGNH/GDSL hydrolase family protein [Oscillospiraceae bacterium]|nr:SGNH/GDSL hydrolase family protein [Oscillospiraceae bacterium]
MKKTIRIAVYSVLTLGALLAVQRLLTPKYMESLREGALVGEYYGEDKSHEVIFVGDCELYSNISPMTLWTEYGVTSYIRGSAQQLIWQSYYLLEETLKYEKPKVAVFSVLAMKYDKPQSEAYNRLTLDGMRLSASKLGSVSASATAGEDLISYIFPLLRYHDRWREIGADDLKYFFTSKKVSHNGFIMRCDIKPVGVVPSGLPLASYDFGDNSREWLDRISELCADNGVELMLIKAPSLNPHWYDQWDAQIREFADDRGHVYINTLEHLGEIGLDFDTDTHNAGSHLNLYGAEKLSSWIGGEMLRYYGLTDNRADARLSALWGQKKAAYDLMRAAQISEIAEYGEIRSFLID